MIPISHIIDIIVHILINVNFTEQWLKAHPLKCSISIKQLDRIDAPFTYGIFHPIILIHINTE